MEASTSTAAVATTTDKNEPSGSPARTRNPSSFPGQDSPIGMGIRTRTEERGAGFLDPRVLRMEKNENENKDAMGTRAVVAAARRSRSRFLSFPQ